MYSDFLRRKFAALESDLVDTVSGYPCVLPKSKGKNLKDYTIYGNDGGVGRLITDEADANFGKYEVPVVSRGKNLIPYPYTSGSQTRNGVTFTINDDGSILVNGTASATIWFPIAANMQNILNKNTRYTISINNVVSGCYLYISCTKNGSWTKDIGLWGNKRQLSFGLSNVDYDKLSVNYYVYTGTTFNNIVLKPQIEEGTVATEYEPYQAPQRTYIYLDSPIGAGQSVNYKADGLPSIPTVKGTTIIEAETQIKPSNIEAKYVKEK